MVKSTHTNAHIIYCWNLYAMFLLLIYSRKRINKCIITLSHLNLNAFITYCIIIACNCNAFVLLLYIIPPTYIQYIFFFVVFFGFTQMFLALSLVDDFDCRFYKRRHLSECTDFVSIIFFLSYFNICNNILCRLLL